MEEFVLTSPRNIDRRVFVKGIGFISLSLLMATCGGCEGLSEAIMNRPMRRWIRTGSAAVDADIAVYKDAVSKMKLLLPSDLRYWSNYAGIHGTQAHGFNKCQHGTNHFFSWHRAYLFYFEKICQQLTNNPKFGLPYWNWNQNRDIPASFFGVGNPLNMSDRTFPDLEHATEVSDTVLDGIFSDTNFFTFSSQLEGTPHNTIHSRIGGLTGLFGSGGSAGDPLFWAHHCMVDYCWAKWNYDLNNDNTNDPAWLSTLWQDHFVDAIGHSASMTAGETILMPLLSYQYEGSTIGSNSLSVSVKTKREFQQLEKRLKAGANIKFDIKQRIPIADMAEISIAQPFSKETAVSAADFAAIINNDKAKDKIFASIEYAKLPATSDFFVRVFINLPSANASTSNEDIHYAGSFAFFGTEIPGESPHEGHVHQPKFLVNITNTLENLKKKQELKEGSPISVQLVAVPFTGKFEKEDTRLMLNKIELIVTPVIIKER